MGTPNSAALLSRVSTCTRESLSRIWAAALEPSVGTLWSAVARGRSGRRTLRPASRRDSNAWGEVTSWTRWRSMYRRDSATSWASQILSKRDRPAMSAPSQSGGHDRMEAGRPLAGVLEVMRKVGVEGHGIALRQIVGLATAHQAQ